jgi:acetone carboxylase, gamma subunit
MTEYSKEMIRDLIDGRLPLEEVTRMQQEKDQDRTRRVIEVEQDRVSWDDPILVCLQEHLYVVQKESGERVVKCICGNEFGDYRINWKEASLVYERHPQDGEIFLRHTGADPAWQQLREFYCPGCAALLDVEPGPIGYPFIFNFLPDLEDEEA